MHSFLKQFFLIIDACETFSKGLWFTLLPTQGNTCKYRIFTANYRHSTDKKTISAYLALNKAE
jgi:hypothetical protein